MFFEFCTNKWIKVINSNIGFSHFGKKFLVIRAGIVTGFSTTVQEHSFVEASFLRAFVSFYDFFILKTQNLIMIRVCQFVQNDIRMFLPSPSFEKIFCSGNMNAFFEFWVIHPMVLLEMAPQRMRKRGVYMIIMISLIVTHQL